VLCSGCLSPLSSSLSFELLSSSFSRETSAAPNKEKKKKREKKKKSKKGGGKEGENSLLMRAVMHRSASLAARRPAAPGPRAVRVCICACGAKRDSGAAAWRKARETGAVGALSDGGDSDDGSAQGAQRGTRRRRQSVSGGRGPFSDGLVRPDDAPRHWADATFAEAGRPNTPRRSAAPSPPRARSRNARKPAPKPWLEQELTWRGPGVEGVAGYHAEEKNALVPGRVKRKGAVVLCYTGTGRYGSQLAKLPPWAPEQIQEAQKTVLEMRNEAGVSRVGTDAEALLAEIEDDELPTIDMAVRRALFCAGMIGSRNVGSLSKIGWQRSSRTDKGVHSAMTVVTFKARVPADSAWAVDDGADELGDDLIGEINKFLPPNVRAVAMLRCPHQWSPRAFCQSRTYAYMFPPETFAGTEWSRDKLEQLLQVFVGKHCFHNFGQKTQTLKKKARGFEKRLSAMNTEREALGVSPIDIDEAVEARYPAHMIDDTEPTRHRGQLSLSEQAEDFEEKTGKDTFFWRNIHSIFVEEVSLSDGNWLRVNITGESFMLHEIRLLMGLTTAVVRGKVPDKFLQVALHGPFSIGLPMAPSQYLTLASANFDTKTHLPVDHRPQISPSDERIRSRTETVYRDMIIPHIVELHDSSEMSQMTEFLESGLSILDDVDIGELSRKFDEWYPGELDRREARKAKAQFWNDLDAKAKPLVDRVESLKRFLAKFGRKHPGHQRVVEKINELDAEIEILKDEHFAEWRSRQGTASPEE
jgi:tRNA pseudouridine38-40 synthase